MSETKPPISFLQLARHASSLSCAVAAGFLYSLKRVNPALELELGVGSLVAAVFGWWMSVFLWRQALALAARRAQGEDDQALRRQQWALYGAATLLLGSMMLCYLFALKDVRGSALLQVLQGTGLALLVIAGICVVMVRIIRLLNLNPPADGSTGEPPPHHDP